ncbi:alpha/beta hydrolase [Photobacterium sagamiensis]|uniref:alpha/beta fold hydrolase n=1 Tax=Photobacterium sagamiensis TaxID=2910241 RepID=UPI003D0EB031
MLAFTHDKGHYFSFDGAEIYYEIQGDPDGKPLVLLHGGLGCMTDFNSILESIPDNYKIIGIDLRGHGKSTLGEKELSYAQYQNDIAALLRYLDIHSYSLLGFSDGGIVSYRLAASESSKVEQLITLGSQWRLEENDPSVDFLGRLTSTEWGGMYPESVEYYIESNPQPDFELLIEKVKNVWIDRSPSGYPSVSVSGIKCPTLVMRGDGDFLFSLNEAVELVGKIENSKFMNIPFAEHEAHKEYPEVCHLVINKCLSMS